MVRIFGTSKRKTKDVLVETWQKRKITMVGGSLMVALPIKLIARDRFNHSQPFRWEKGTQVEVAMTPEGLFVIRCAPKQEFGAVTDPEILDQVYGAVSQLKPAVVRRKGKRKITMRRDDGSRGRTVEVDDDGEE